MSHISVPNVNIRYINNDMDEVSFVLIVFTACGTKDAVVQNAAIKPEAVIPSMIVSIES